MCSSLLQSLMFFFLFISRVLYFVYFLSILLNCVKVCDCHTFNKRLLTYLLTKKLGLYPYRSECVSNKFVSVMNDAIVWVCSRLTILAIKPKFHGSSFLVTPSQQGSRQHVTRRSGVSDVTRMLRESYRLIGHVGRVAYGMLRESWRQVTDLPRGSYEETAAVEFSLYRVGVFTWTRLDSSLACLRDYYFNSANVAR